MIDHLEIESTVLHKESEEGKAQMQREGANKMGEHDYHDDHDDKGDDEHQGDFYFKKFEILNDAEGGRQQDG